MTCRGKLKAGGRRTCCPKGFSARSDDPGRTKAFGLPILRRLSEKEPALGARLRTVAREGALSGIGATSAHSDSSEAIRGPVADGEDGARSLTAVLDDRLGCRSRGEAKADGGGGGGGRVRGERGATLPWLWLRWDEIDARERCRVEEELLTGRTGRASMEARSAASVEGRRARTGPGTCEREHSLGVRTNSNEGDGG